MKFFEQFVEDNPGLPVIETLDDLLKEIAYAYDPMYPIYRYKNGVFVIHKLAIGSNWCQYKEHISKLRPGLYAELVKFFEIRYEK